MSMEHDQDQQAHSDAAGDGDTGGAGDLTDVLGGQEASFVSDEKKPLSTATVIMAGLLLACGAGTYLMYDRSAKASVEPTAETAAAQTTITEFLSDDKANVNKMKDLLENTEKAVEQFKASPGKKQVPLDDLQTNPFRIAGSADPNNPDENLDAATAKKREEAARAAALKAAQGLKLTLVLSGRQKSCMINNAVYREGEQVDGFTVEAINADSVIVRLDQTKFKIPIRN
jgi:hypothetical protein